MSSPVRVLALLALTALVAGAGGWIGARSVHRAAAGGGLDQVVHHELNLSAAQQQQIESLETQFAATQRTLQAQMRAANHDLALAMVSEHQYGPAAQQAIDRFHAAMKTLQQRTVEHVLAMRAVLSAEQAARFDQTITKVLGSDQP